MALDYTGQPSHNVTEDSITAQPSDCSKPIPRTLSFSWYSFLTDAIYVLSSVPFIVLTCLLARANGKPIHQASRQEFENGIRIVSVPFIGIKAYLGTSLTFQIGRHGSPHCFRRRIRSPRYPGLPLEVGKRSQPAVHRAVARQPNGLLCVFDASPPRWLESRRNSDDRYLGAFAARSTVHPACFRDGIERDYIP